MQEKLVELEDVAKENEQLLFCCEFTASEVMSGPGDGMDSKLHKDTSGSSSSDSTNFQKNGRFIKNQQTLG